MSSATFTDPEEIIDAGDRLFTRMRLRSTGKASGARTEDVLYQVFTLREDRAIRAEFSATGARR